MDALLEYDAIAVGAGPTGLAFSLEMKRHGMSVLSLDRLPEAANTSRAAVIHARTLEVLEPSGVTSDLLSSGLVVPTFRIRSHDNVLLSISFNDLETKYPFTLMCPQDRTEAILLARLNALGASVRRPCEVTAVQQIEGGARVEFVESGEVRSSTARWVLGCDGSHSVVREQAGIPFEGGSYSESFVIADVEMNWPLSREEVTGFVSEKGLMVVAPLPPANRFRIVATTEVAPHEPPVELFEQILEERGPQADSPKITRGIWTSRFHIEHRVAQRLRSGSVLIAGDAAHVHSPAGGQGMNTGIQDAVSLAAALKEEQDDPGGNALAAWEKRRLEVAHDLVNLTDMITKGATIRSPLGRWARHAVFGIVGHLPQVRHVIARKLAELDNR